jgi:hypothetical protein
MHIGPKILRLRQNNCSWRRGNENSTDKMHSKQLFIRSRGRYGGGGRGIGRFREAGAGLESAPVQGVAEKTGGSGASQRSVRVERVRTLERRGIAPPPCN